MSLSIWRNRLSAIRRPGFRPLLEILEGRNLPSATYSTTILGDSPTAYWRLGEASGTTAVDASPNGFNGTYVGGGIQLGQAGAIVDDTNTAVGFTGAANTGVTLPPLVFNFTGFTQESFEVWFRVNPGNGGVILGQVGNAGVPPGSAAFSGWVPAVYIDTTGVVRSEMFWHGFVGPIQSGPGFNDGSWHHLVNVFNAGTETLFIDGVQRATGGPGLVESPYAGGPANYSYFLGTGQTSSWPGGNGDWFYLNGTLDEAAVYQNKALTLAQIQNHFETGRANDVSFQMAAYTVREDAGTAQIAITRSGDLNRADSVRFSTLAGGTATSPSDYNSVLNQVVNFGIGQATANATVQIANRPGIQPNRTVDLALIRNGATAAVVSPTDRAQLTIADVDTSTTLASSANPSAFGQAVTFTATVTPTGMSGPTGTVTFFDNGTTLGTVALNAAQQAAFTTQTLTAGAHTITATYNCDANFTTSTGTLTQTVAVVNTSTTLASSANPSAFGQAVTFTATVTPTGMSGPTGTVTFFDNGSPLGTVALNAAQQAAFTTQTLTAGAHTITATYNGDANFTTSTGTLTQTVTPPATTGTPTQPITPPATTGGLFATGPDAGFAPEVKVFTTSGVLRFDFYAFEPSFTGGVRVAVGDVNGDGTPDIITVPGVGGGPLVKVFSGKDLSLILSFNAYDPGLTTGLYVAAGDVNHDGVADIITAPDLGGGPLVNAFDGKTGAKLLSFNAYDPAFLGGVRVAAGDTNGDGFADIITGPGFGGGPLVRIFSGKDGSNLLSYNAYAGSFVGGIFVGAADVDGDGKADVLTTPGVGGGPLVNVFSGPTGVLIQSFNAYPPVASPLSIFGSDSVWQSGLRVAALDVNGDGKADIITGVGPSQRPEVKVFDAVTLGVLDDFFAYDQAYLGGVFVGAGK